VITVKTTGSFARTLASLRKMQKLDIPRILDTCGRQGVQALSGATPRDSGRAASSWYFEVTGGKGRCAISWLNNDVEEGFPVAIMLQYGYGTGTGGYVYGIDYINPAIKPVFDAIAAKVWKEVVSA
jgi:hypothetical protein